MRALVQRVARASVRVDGEEIARIGRGLLVLLGVHVDDGREAADRIVRKLRALRVFDDADGRMNLDASTAGAEFLCVSNFTLYGNASRGNRPSFVDAAPPDRADPLYEYVRDGLGAQGGRFAARMAIELVADGPVTLLIEA
ncbi:MAG: D-tyrosyl-tRNA(Tyr) deacylase [Actinobacteria bacterium]|nr:D-tyrosyl-tRNA(Tyr) deacylase [Actinomycetota bacterium]